ncbi:SDR family oxidoreductase [Nocardia vinacea]|uniref:SDR family oxidoreductase n=1 Tax=Nocardia vinacea TaxID=96468 RepID=A0ABZ1YX56_9NOCA|nr:SDR family oxidoreductase [Nocardia vinacea]
MTSQDIALKPFDLSGKTALITGATRGLGRAIADAFAGAGADIVVVSRKPEACEKVAAELTATHGVRTWPMACNVSSWEQCTELADRAEAATSGVDVLVNNAGMSPLYPSLTQLDEGLYDKVFGVNTKGPFRLAILLGEAMHGRGHGSIINLSSVESLYPTPHALPYAAAKAALNVIGKGLAREFGPTVRVNTILAGPFLTDIAKSWDMAAFDAIARRGIALQRAGSPDEIVGAALYLASDAASYTTGSEIRVDGGVFGAFV